MIAIQKCDVPTYLQSSDFYKGLSDNKGEEFNLSIEHFKPNCEIRDNADLDHLLSTLRFWGSTEYPKEFYDYIWTKEAAEFEPVLALYWNELTDLKCCVEKRRFHAAVQYGNMSFVRYMLNLGCTCSWPLCQTAARYGRLECLKLLLPRITIDDAEVLQHITHAAIEAGQFECLQYMAEHNNDNIDWLRCLYLAAGCGSLCCLKYVYEEKCNRQYCTYMDFYAVQGGDEQYLAFAMEHNLPYDYTVLSHVMMRNAVQRGVLAIVEYLHTNRFELHPNLFIQAAACGYVDIMHYVFTHTRCDAQTCFESSTVAACNGHLNCLEYAKCHFPVPWDINATIAAAAWNQLECLKYLHEQGCPWGYAVTEIAVRNKSAECLNYAILHGCPIRLKYRVKRWWKSLKKI